MLYLYNNTLPEDGSSGLVRTKNVLVSLSVSFFVIFKIMFHLIFFCINKFSPKINPVFGTSDSDVMAINPFSLPETLFTAI